jgi:hypothetical protein
LEVRGRPLTPAIPNQKRLVLVAIDLSLPLQFYVLDVGADATTAP